MKKSLAEFCLEAHKTISSLRGRSKLKVFLKYRYRLLRKDYPHEPFSVEQAEYSFFEDTYKYLTGELDIDKITKSDYNNNYIKWIKAHQQVKTKSS